MKFPALGATLTIFAQEHADYFVVKIGACSSLRRFANQFRGGYFQMGIIRFTDIWNRPYKCVSGYSLDGSFGVSVVMCRPIASDLAEEPMRDSCHFKRRSANIPSEFGSSRMAEVHRPVSCCPLRLGPANRLRSKAFTPTGTPTLSPQKCMTPLRQARYQSVNLPTSCFAAVDILSSRRLTFSLNWSSTQTFGVSHQMCKVGMKRPSLGEW